MNYIKNKKNLRYLSPQELDNVELSASQYSKGAIIFLLSSAIAIFVFFVNLTIGDNSNIVFGWIFNFFVGLIGDLGLWLMLMIMVGNLLLHVWTKYIDKGKRASKLSEFYQRENAVHTLLYVIGVFYMAMHTLHTNVPGFVGLEIIVGAHTGDTVISFIVLPVSWIILTGAVFMPFLVNYGLLEFVGTLLEPLMRPAFRLPGKAALSAVASLFTTTTLAVLITNRLYKQKVFTEQETIILATSFCTVSIGFTHLVVATAGMSHYFMLIFATGVVICFILAAIMIRIPPLSQKRQTYSDGSMQIEEDSTIDTKYNSKTVSKSVRRSLKRAYTANSPLVEISKNVSDCLKIIPQVMTMISAVGITALIIAEYTPIFRWLGLIFQPLIMLLQIPDAAAIAPSIPVGIAEMFLPVLLIAGQVDTLTEQARFFVTTISIVQIVFFAETASVILAVKMPISVKELVIVFFERTLLAMPLVAVAAHIFVPSTL